MRRSKRPQRKGSHYENLEKSSYQYYWLGSVCVIACAGVLFFEISTGGKDDE